MATTKSFREYLAEKELLREDDNEERVMDDNITDNENQEANDKIKQDENKPTDSEKDKSKYNPEYFNVYKDFKIRTTSKDPVNKFKELRAIKDVIERSYEALRDNLYMEAIGFNPPVTFNANKENSQETSNIYLNLTGSNSLTMIKKEWDEINESLLKSAEQTHKNAQHSGVMKRSSGIFSNKADTTAKEKSFDYLIKAAERGESVPEWARIEAEKRKKAKEEAETNKEEPESKAAKKFTNDGIKFFKEERELEEGLLNSLKKSGGIGGLKRRLRDSISTVGELSSGMNNRYGSKNIITTANKGRSRDEFGEKKGIYNIVNSNFLESVYKRFLSSAESIASKKLWSGEEYLKRAQKNLDKHENLRYVGDDDIYLSSISRDLFRALNVATSIGYSLQNLCREYQNSLNKISEEFKLRKLKDERSMESLDSKVSYQKYAEKQINKDVINPHKSADKITDNGKTLNDADEKARSDEAEKAQYEEDEKKWRAIKNEVFDNVLSALNGAKKDDSDFNLNKLLMRIDSDTNAENPKFKQAKNKDGVRLEKSDLALASAIASRFIYDLIDNKETKKIIFSESIRKELEKAFDEKYDSIRKSTVGYSTGEVNDTLKKIIKNRIEHPKTSKSEAQNDSNKNTKKVNSRFNKAKDRAEEEKDATKNLSGTGSKIEKFRKKVQEKDAWKQKWAMAKDFNGANPKPAAAKEFDGGSMNIVQYAVEKAKKLNER